MRRTPPVVVQLQPQAVVQAFAVLVGLLAAGGLALWALGHQSRAWPLLHADPGSCWLPLLRRQQVAHWGALRATLLAAPGGAVRR